MDLSTNELSRLPMCIEQCTHLQALILHNNEIRTLPSEFGEWFPMLDELSLAHNKIKELPQSISNLTRLKSMDCSFNKITSIGHLVSTLPEK